MTRDELLDRCSKLTGAVEDYPFGEGVAVFKVAGKMFALVPLDGDPVQFNVKCHPDLALDLRTRYGAVLPGYHQNKRYWNTVVVDGSIEDGELREMLQHSYDLVVASLTKAARSRLQRT